MGQVVEMLQAKKQQAAQEPALAESAQAGNQEAFRQLVDRYKVLVFSLAYSRTGSVVLSEDIAQESFLEAWRDLAQLRDPGKFRSWLCRIATRTISRMNQAERRPVVAIPDASGSLSDDFSSVAPSPLDRMITDEEEALVRRALTDLPAAYRLPIILYYQEGRSVENVAKTLDLSADNVRKRIGRGRQMLREGVLVTIESVLERLAMRREFTASIIAAIAGISRVTTAEAAPRPAPRAALVASVAVGLGLVAIMIVPRLSRGPGSDQSKAQPKSATAARAAPRSAPPRIQSDTWDGEGARDEIAPIRIGHPESPLVLGFDFEDGMLPEIFRLGEVVSCPPKSDSRYCAVGTFAGSAMAVSFSPANLYYRETLALEFDYWVDATTGEVTIDVWNEQRQSNFGRVLTPNGSRFAAWGLYENILPRRWSHVSLPLSILHPAKKVGNAEPGDKLKTISLYAGAPDRFLFYVDNVRVVDRGPEAAVSSPDAAAGIMGTASRSR